MPLFLFCLCDRKKNNPFKRKHVHIICTKITFENVRCHNGDCVLASQRCNRESDCSDLSDEIHCGKFPEKKGLQFFFQSFD